MLGKSEPKHILPNGGGAFNGDESHGITLKISMSLSQISSNLAGGHTVDGRNPVPPGMYETPLNNGINYLSTGAGFQASTGVILPKPWFRVEFVKVDTVFLQMLGKSKTYSPKW